MKQSKLLVPTLRETPSEAEIKSHQLLIKAGYIRQISGGLFTYLPLAHRVMMKIVAIIRKEFEKLDAFEMIMPNLLPISYRNDEVEDSQKGSLFSVKDENEKEYMLAPTHEKAFLELIKNDIQSYRKLPMNLFQVQMKYRDEEKPKNGLMTSREFLMADVYSFHIDNHELDKNFYQFEAAVSEIFNQCGLTYLLANGELNRQGISKMREFVAPAIFGNQTICYSTESDYAANLAVAVSEYDAKRSHATYLDIEKVVTTGMKSAVEIANGLNEELQQVVKTFLYFVDSRPVIVLIRGDHELNLSKLKAFFKGEKVKGATEDEVITVFGASFGSIGPVALPMTIPIYADLYVADMVNMICGANEEGVQLKNVNIKRDFFVTEFVDFHLVKEGEKAPNHQGIIKYIQGIEIAQLMKLDSSYTDPLSRHYLNDQGELTPLSMGYYRIGVSRMLAMIVEQYGNDNSIMWPRAIAPFFVHILPMDYEEAIQQKLTEDVCEMMEQAGYEVLVDDREERPGVKFADSELIGCPVRITVGKKAQDGVVELMILESKATVEVRKEELVDTLSILLQSS